MGKYTVHTPHRLVHNIYIPAKSRTALIRLLFLLFLHSSERNRKLIRPHKSTKQLRVLSAQALPCSRLFRIELKEGLRKWVSIDGVNVKTRIELQ